MALTFDAGLERLSSAPAGWTRIQQPLPWWQYLDSARDQKVETLHAHRITSCWPSLWDNVSTWHILRFLCAFGHLQKSFASYHKGWEFCPKLSKEVEMRGHVSGQDQTNLESSRPVVLIDPALCSQWQINLPNCFTCFMHRPSCRLSCQAMWSR